MSISNYRAGLDGTLAHPLGRWMPGSARPLDDAAAFRDALGSVRSSLFIVDLDGAPAVACDGAASLGAPNDGPGGWRESLGALPLLAYLPPTPPEALGDSSFCRDLGLRYPYLAGAMANGIGSEGLVEAMAHAGMLGFFGAAGLAPERVEQAVTRLQERLGPLPHGCNLIHSPNEPAVESAVVDILLKHRVQIVEASAYLQLTLPVVRYRVHGITRDGSGKVVTPNRIIAKVSREEVAAKFFSPPPEKFLKKLVEEGAITAGQAILSQEIPMAQDLTAEADSGGHTDRRPAVALLPTLLALRDGMQEKFGYAQPLRVGLAGGISTPASAAAAFAMGAAYVLTGSVNQACVESGTSDAVRGMLAQTRQADVAMAPAADMFEMGVTVQVLKRGTMFSMRASKLYELYRRCAGLDDIPAAEREKLEKSVFRAPLASVWEQTRAFFEARDPRQIERANKDPKHQMALVFRWYLGQSSAWANQGLADRVMDYQIWCGPAMGAFNEWVRGSFLEAQERREAVTVALNLLYGAAVVQRVANLRQQGISVPADVARLVPVERPVLEEILGNITLEERRLGVAGSV